MTYLNDISKIYLEQIAESAVPGKPSERLGAVTAIPKFEQDAAKERILAKASAKRAKMKESLDPVGQEDADVDNDGKKNTKSDKYLIKRRKAIGKALATRKEETEITEIHAQAHKPHEVPDRNLKGLVAKAVKRIDTDVDGDTDYNDRAKGELGEFVPGVGNKRLYSSTRTKKVKEGFSNWRQDLAEIMSDVIDSKPIKEKKVNNKIKTSAMGSGLKLGESIEEIGGTLLEMVQINEVDFIVESVYGELLDEGYEEDDIEDALEYALIEAKVTYGHDTEKPYQKKTNIGRMVKSVGRLARQKLSSKYRGTKRATAGAIASGARQVARGALGVARKMEGDKKPHPAHKPTIRGPKRPPSAAGQRERVSSGSYTPPKAETKPEPKKSSQVADPWGPATTPPKKSSPKPQAKTSEPKSDSGLSARQKAAAIRAQRRNINISPEDLKRVISNVKEDYSLLEKAESEQQQKIFGLALSVKRGDTSRSEVSDRVLKIVDGMSEKEIRKFAKTKHEGIPHKVETKEEVLKQNIIDMVISKIEETHIDEAKLPRSMKKGKKKLESKTQVIHDVDDNLADQRHPDAAKIDVMRRTDGSWKRVKSLTPSQFAHHKLRKPGEPVKEEKDPGDKYGFNQFRDTEKFKKTTKPNKPVVRLGDSPKRPAQKSVVTARGGSEFGSKKPSTPMDKPGEFAKDLKNRIGVKNLERKNVHFTGGMRKGSGPEKKAEVVKKIVKPDAKKVITTDDHLQNVRHMAAAASSAAPKAKILAYQSKPATKEKGKVKPGDITPVRVGKEKNLGDTKIGIRSNTLPSTQKTPKKTQKRRKQQKMGEAIESPQTKETQQNASEVKKVLQARMKSVAAQRDLANRQKMAVQKGVNLSSIS